MATTEDFASNGIHETATYSHQPTTVLPWTSVLLAATQWLIFVVGTLGNLVVLVVLVWCRPDKNKTTQLFVGSLSLANLGLILSSGWVQGLMYLKNSWRFGVVGCKVYYTIQTVSPYWAIWTLAMLALDRYIGMSKPSGGNYFKYPAAIAIIISIWTLLIICNIPLIVWCGLSESSSTSTRCVILGTGNVSGDGEPYDRVQIAFIASSRMFNYFVPLIANWVCYCGIIRQFHLSLTQVQAVAVVVAATRAGTLRRIAARRVTVMCLVIASCFTLTTLPYQVGVYILLFATDTNRPSFLASLRTVLMFNCCLSPVVYGFLWRPFRRSILKLTPVSAICRRIVNRQRKTTSSEQTMNEDNSAGVTGRRQDKVQDNGPTSRSAST